MVPVIICLTQPASIFANSQWSFPFQEIPATILPQSLRQLEIYVSNDLFSKQVGSSGLKVAEFALRPERGTGDFLCFSLR